MFAYCGNNPVIHKDTTGHFPIIATVVICASLCLLLTASDPRTVADQKKRDQKKYNKELDKARENYNNSNVNINNGLDSDDAKIDVDIYPDYEKNGKYNPQIVIDNSYKVKTRAEKQAILEVVIGSPEFDDNVFKRGMDSWIAEWEGHNFLYYSPLGIIFDEKLGSANLDENNKIPWDVIW